MSFEKIVIPSGGEPITINEAGKLNVPNNPIIPFIEGDGIGTDITPAMIKVIDNAVETAYGDEKKISWMEIYCGEKSVETYGNDTWLPDETIDAIKEYIVAIKGPLTTPIGGGIRSLNVALRQKLDLYSCERPITYFEGVPSPVIYPESTDMVVLRENSEDIYAGIEFKADSDEAKKVIKFFQEEMGVGNIRFEEFCGIGVKPISKPGTERLVRKAIQYAVDNDRSSVTLVHKGNIMKFTEGAFKDWGYEIAKDEYPEKTISEDEVWNDFNGVVPNSKLVIKDRIADSMFQQILLRPSEYDVITTPNLNGDYISDAAAAQVGGLGMAPGANMGDEIALFEATHGTAPKYANLNKINPSSVILSGVMMFEYLEFLFTHLSSPKKKSIFLHGIFFSFAKFSRSSAYLKS